jgi:hypothetical protein
VSPGGSGLRFLGAVALLAAGALGCSLATGAARQASDVVGALGDTLGAAQEGAAPSGDASRGGSGANTAERMSPQLSVGEVLSLAYPRVDEGGIRRVSRAVNGNLSDWPEIGYLGEEIQIGEVGYDPVAVRPVEVRIVQGDSVPLSYSPELDVTRPWPDGSPRSIRGRLDRPIMVIPPNGSLVMVKIETTPSVGRWVGPGDYQCPEGEERDWDYRADDFYLAYPGLGEAWNVIEGDQFWFGEYQWPGYGCPGDGWLYFTVAGVGLDPSQLSLEHVSGEKPGEVAVWTLTDRP